MTDKPPALPDDHPAADLGADIERLRSLDVHQVVALRR